MAPRLSQSRYTLSLVRMGPLQLALACLLLVQHSQGSFTRCFKCRSRGDLGSCKDPFKYGNASALEGVQGVEAVPCTSGWCGKILDRGTNTFKDEEYGSATERVCLQRGPDDSEERCAPTTWSHEKVFMCFCQGDLCNAAPAVTLLPLFIAIPIIASFVF